MGAGDPGAALADRAAIVRAVNDWGLWRDTGRWERLRGLYTPGATMHTTWFAGPASEFVERSIAAAKGGRGRSISWGRRRSSSTATGRLRRRG